jgi:hypothetical protein
MVRYLYGGVLRAEWNGTLRFRATDAVKASDGQVLHPVDDLTTMAAIQAELARTLLPTVGQLARIPQVKRISSGEVRVAPRDSLPRMLPRDSLPRVPRSPQR